jgi:hypothetical protein
MRYTICGRPTNPLIPRGQVRCVTWDNGTLGGDLDMVQLVREESLALNGIQIGPHEGPYTVRNHLREPISASLVIRGLLEPDSVRHTGDVPERPQIPPNSAGD